MNSVYKYVIIRQTSTGPVFCEFAANSSEAQKIIYRLGTGNHERWTYAEYEEWKAAQ